MNKLSKLNQQSTALRLRRLAPWAVLGLLAAGCLVDSGDRCGPNQVLLPDETRCVCLEGYVAGTGGCVPCGANEVPDPVAGCACATGFVRAGAGAGCQALPAGVQAPTGVGKPCTAPGDCTGLDASYCESLVSHTCLVPNCTVSPDNCFTGSECCDFTSIGLPPLCIGAGLCQQ